MKSPDLIVFMNLVMLFTFPIFMAVIYGIYLISIVFMLPGIKLFELFLICHLESIVICLNRIQDSIIFLPFWGIDLWNSRYSTIFHSDKKLISSLRLCQENNCRSTFGCNIRNICIGNETMTIFNCKKFALKYFPLKEEYIWRLNVLKQLKQIGIIEGFSENEIKDIIEYIACRWCMYVFISIV